jgi:UDP-N-acetylmuramoylalanine--D-glutamate ligase
VARHARAAGDDVTVVDDRANRLDPTSEGAAAALEVVVEPVPGPSDVGAVLDRIDVVVPSPGVPEGHPLVQGALARGVPVRAEVDLAAEAAAARGIRLVAVTGTNGKTTVTDLTTTMLRTAGADARSAGNIGTALLDAVDAVEGADPAGVTMVAEVSSYQLRFTTAAFRPAVAVLLNVADDHLDWHRTSAAYARAKARVFRHQHREDVLVYNADDPVVAGLVAEAPGRRLAYSVVDGAAGGFRVADTAGGRLLLTPDGRELLAVDELPAGAPHDLGNTLAAAAAAMACGADSASVARAARDFVRAPHRMQPVGERAGVRYVDDSKATNVHAALAAIRGFDRVVLVAGGRNKGLDLRGLREEAARLVAVVAIGDAADELVEAFEGMVAVTVAHSMRDAVRIASNVARAGDVVLLSPACASFDWYGSYAQRGDDFAREVRALEGVVS